MTKFGDYVRVSAWATRVVGHRPSSDGGDPYRWHLPHGSLVPSGRPSEYFYTAPDELHEDGWPGIPVPGANPIEDRGTPVRVRRISITPTRGIVIGKVRRAEGTRVYSRSEYGNDPGVLLSVRWVTLCAVGLKQDNGKPKLIYAHLDDMRDLQGRRL